MKTLLALLTLTTLLHLSVRAAETATPNIIYINTDDWGIGKVPPYKYDPVSEKVIQTPNLAALKRDGLTFTNAYAGNAVCGPSRCSLLTGKHPGNTVWRANRKTMPAELWPPEYPLLGTVARNSGYTTAAFGKVSFGGTATPEQITATGWDYWLGFLGHIDCRDYYANYIWENGKKIPLPKNTPELLKGTSMAEKGKNYLEGTGTVGDDKGTFIEDLYADKIIEFITANKAKPFFVYFASTVPHGGPPGGMRVPSIRPEYKNNKSLTHREQLYCELMSRHDANLGRIRTAVEKLGLVNNTIIIWTSDNGDEDSYYKRTKTFDGNGPFRDMKRSLHEGGIRTPMFALWPGTIKPGTTTNLITTQWDLMPTIANAAQKPITSEMDGISILPTLAGTPEKQTNRDYIYYEFYEGGKQQSVRSGNWKAYRSFKKNNKGTQGKIELYDLSKDIAETNNLAAKHPDIIKKMAAIMQKEHTPTPIYKLPITGK